MPSDLRHWQSALADHLLLPEKPLAGCLEAIEPWRLKLYEELLFNTVLETLESIYPHCHRLLSRNGQDEEGWRKLAERYRRAYPNPSHKLMGAVWSFAEFLANQQEWIAEAPYLPDLARYEWLEMEVLNLPDVSVPAGFLSEVSPPELWMTMSPCWNPARRLEHFDYHVPKLLEALKAADFELQGLSLETEPVDILIYRDPVSLDARFFCLNALTARLLAVSEGRSYQAALDQLITELPMLRDLPVETVRQQAAGLFENCLQNGLLLGSCSVASQER